MPIFFPSGGGSDYPDVANFAALPAAASVSGATYLVRAAQGVYFVNRKAAGLYSSDGAAWNYLAEDTVAYFQDTLAWTNITSKPATFTPSAHAASHATGQADAISPSAIGAEPTLGNPGVSGYILSSSAAGVRTWVENSGGGGGGTALTSTLNFLTEENYVENTVSDAEILATSKIVVGLQASEDAAIQGVVCGVKSVADGSAIIYGGAPNGASGIFNVNLILV